MKIFSNEETLDRLAYSQSSIECGIHSGLPACCVRFFVTEKIWMNSESKAIYSKRIDARVQEIGKAWMYIPCPDCLNRGIIVTVKPCPRGMICNPEDGRDMVNVIKIELNNQINNVRIGFQAIKNGSAPTAGSVSVYVSRCIESLFKLVNQ